MTASVDTRSGKLEAALHERTLRKKLNALKIGGFRSELYELFSSIRCDILNVEKSLELRRNMRCKTCGREHTFQRIFMRHA
jgi:hypothetical protein